MRSVMIVSVTGMCLQRKATDLHELPRLHLPMPGRIDDIFASLRSQGRKALMPFVCAGYPTRETTAAVLPALERAGASIIEVGIPFSDPIADGSVIAAAMHQALGQGHTPLDAFSAVAQARPQVNAGIVAMVSVSIVYKTGAERFAQRAREA